MKLRPDLLDDASAPGIEVFQLTDEPGIPWSHIYMEAQVFTPDSRRLVVHRSAKPHGGLQNDPQHRYYLCDLDNRGELSPLTEECGVTGPSLSPDGRWLYYFHDETSLNGGRMTLKRVGLDGRGRESLLVLDRPAEGAVRRISRLYPLSTISSDGRRIAISGFFGDGRREPPPWGLLVFDLDTASARLVLEGPSWCNIHPQYSRSQDPVASRDLLVQENHGNLCTTDGVCRRGVGGPGCDIHVIRDDATGFRDLPWGRNLEEFCEGHQCWRGRGATAITSAGGGRLPPDHILIEGLPAPHDGHLGAATAGGRRTVLSASCAKPRFHHFATDAEARRLISDYTIEGKTTTELVLAEFDPAPDRPLRNWCRLLDTRSPRESSTHAHPFLSPDGTMAFFNSSESGVLNAYLVRGLPPSA
jgi:hypothetical protein